MSASTYLTQTVQLHCIPSFLYLTMHIIAIWFQLVGKSCHRRHLTRLNRIQLTPLRSSIDHLSKIKKRYQRIEKSVKNCEETFLKKTVTTEISSVRHRNIPFFHFWFLIFSISKHIHFSRKSMYKSEHALVFF